MKTMHPLLHKYMLLGIALLLSFPVFAQFTISGQVVDAETKQPLEGASVFAQNTTKGVITNKEGSYQIQLAKGGYELVISYTGYASKLLNIEASGDKHI